MQDRIAVRNEGPEPVSFQVALEVGSDFADIFTVKAYDFSFGDPLHAPPLPPLAEPRWDAGASQFVLGDPASDATTQVILSRAPSGVEGGWASFAVELESRERWELVVDVVPSPSGEVVGPEAAERRFGEELQHIRDSLTTWQLRVPQLRADWDDLERTVTQSIADLAALRIRGKENGRVARGRLPAAGMPWFMTVFGRDSIITGLQTLLLGPELARSALEELADLQATEDDRDDAEPGDRPRGAPRQGIRVGSRLRDDRRDAALPDPPLGGLALDRRRRPRPRPAGAGVARPRVDRAVRRPDGDGFVEYEKRSRGLDNQS
jgi:glycogen debranching enzyme